MEQKLIYAAISGREAFDLLLSQDVQEFLSDPGKIVWDELKEYYGRDPSASLVDVALLESGLKRKHPKHIENFKQFLAEIPVPSPTNLLHEFLEVKKDVLRTRIQIALSRPGADTEATALFEQYAGIGTARSGGPDEQLWTGDRLLSVLDKRHTEGRIAVLPTVLNAQLDGGVRAGHHIVLFAPYEMGKSLFALNMAYGFCKQGLKVLYLENEDPEEDTARRFMVRATGLSFLDIDREPEKAKRILTERNFHTNFVLRGIAPGTLPEIDGLIRNIDPHVVIVNQIRNLDVKEASRVIQLEKAATAMRNFGKKYNKVMVSITQAGDSATGKAILQRGDIDFSNVGIPATADLIIGIGATEDDEANGFRVLSFTKNKISGNKSPIRCRFDTHLMRVS
jgi:archaellum biogenesis ATPase FlaH